MQEMLDNLNTDAEKQQMKEIIDDLKSQNKSGLVSQAHSNVASFDNLPMLEKRKVTNKHTMVLKLNK